MASKGLHVQDNSVAERRLRPIYDWLDIGNNKKALQECEKVLKKTPNLHCAKALKALTLHRMGKTAECVVILDSLAEEKPTDDATLQALTLCCREMQELNRICKLYETAVKLDPSNEELHTHLFMSYVRISDFKSQQQAAMTLYKHKPKNPYYCWAVMSIILQATRGEGSKDKQKRTLLLSLAERMMVKLVTDNKLEAEQEVQLYVMILELQEKYEEILTLMDGPLGAKLVCNNAPQNRLKYYIKVKKWNNVNLLCKQILNEQIDRWDVWKDYINSVFEIMALPNGYINNHDNHVNTSDNYVEVVDDTPEKAHEFICRIVENGAENGYLLRGPYLARFELCSKLAQKDMDSTELLGETIELFIEYFRKFGHKSCCVSDLRIYLNLLDADKKSDLSTRLIKDVGISSTSVPQTEQQMQRHICALQLARLCGGHRNLSVEHLRALVTALSLHYQHGYQTYGTNLLPTDMGPSDHYALLAVHVLYDLAQLEQKSDGIIVALILLENLLKNSPSNFHAKLLSVKLSHFIGNTLGADEMNNSLDIKHLQLDSLGYIHCGRLSTCGLFTDLFDTTLKFFSSNYKDSSDHLTFSYKFGSFYKLEEFMDFRERLNNSLHYTSVAIDRIFLSLINCTTSESLFNLDISPRDNKIDWDSLQDNHDLSVYLSWDPERIEGPIEESEDIKMQFEQDICFLKLRTSILWAFSAAVDIVKSTDGTREKHIENLRNILSDWDVLYRKTITANYIPISQKLITNPLPSRLHGALKCPIYDVLSKLFNFLLKLCKDDLDSLAYFDEVKQSIHKISPFLEENTLKTSSDFIKRRESIELLVNCQEVLSLSCLICLLCNDLAKPLHKKGKKKSSGNVDSKARSLLTDIATAVKNEINSTVKLIETWESNVLSDELVIELEALNLNTDGKSVCSNLINSYKLATIKAKFVLQEKLKLLTGLVG